MMAKGDLGRLVLVVGPSGAGKDSLIDYARNRLQTATHIRFARRVITRPASVGEDHESVDLDEFRRRTHDGAYALHWQAHGLCYGIPRVIDDWLGCRKVVVANVSRAILAEARERYPRLLVINVTASPEILTERLARRGREDASSLRERIARGSAYTVEGDDTLLLNNSGALSVAGDQFVNTLMAVALVAEPDPGPRCTEATVLRSAKMLES